MYKVKGEPLVWISLSDTTHLAAKLWMPVQSEKKSQQKFPAILEFLPYRRNDFTSIRDEKRHPWMSSQGYVMIRVDMRGTGDSEGLYYDEYEKQEQDDCVEVIGWIRRQPWSSGVVGMVGKSWGGFNSLQVASRNPEGLKAIISVCSTDDRYDDNCHFKQGCVVPSEMLSWSCFMLMWNTAPPDPQFVGSKWKDIWLERLQIEEPWINRWLSHQTRDDYWKHASICEDYSKIQCAVYLIGGWADSYCTAIFRMAEKLSCDWKALIGPWPHQFPDDCNPGPRIGYLQESLRFWDYHLKGIENGINKEPRFRVYLQESIPASPVILDRPGRWVAEDQWPSSNVAAKKFELIFSGALQEFKSVPAPSSSSNTTSLELGSPFSVGAAAGDLWPSGAPGQFAQDQGWQDGQCRCWHGDVLEKPVDILGSACLELEVSSDKPLATLCARLVDVFPDGKATLISTGVLNLTHRNGHSVDLVEGLEPNKHYNIEMNFDKIGYTILEGHTIRLALSQSNWPNQIWPPPFIPNLLLHFSSTPVLTLPIRNFGEKLQEKDRALADLGQPVFSPALPTTELRKPSFQRYFINDMVNNSYKTVYDEDFGKTLRTDSKLIFGRSNKKVYDIKENDPLSATVTIETNQTVAREEAVSGGSEELFDTHVQTKSCMSADEKYFYIDSEVTAWSGEELVFEKKWKKSIERYHV